MEEDRSLEPLNCRRVAPLASGLDRQVPLEAVVLDEIDHLPGADVRVEQLRVALHEHDAERAPPGITEHVELVFVELLERGEPERARIPRAGRA
jgi:hypothetical protein